MTKFTFDVPAVLTLHIDAPSEYTARRMIDQVIEMTEGNQWHDGHVSGFINAIGRQGSEAETLVEIDGEAV